MPIGFCVYELIVVMKKEHAFDPDAQQEFLSSKIVASLERISQAFKLLLWDKAKQFGLSPIQIQILIFVANHKNQWNNVSYLANEFNVTKPTVSDAVRVLHKKNLILKDHSSSDNRSYSIVLSEAGKAIVADTEDFSSPLISLMETFPKEEQQGFYRVLAKLIHGLHRNQILTVQRSCLSCKFYGNHAGGHYCNLLETLLEEQDIRLDCSEFEKKTV